jgi:hypothetical protein
MTIRCHAHPCREPGLVVGTFEGPFCAAHYAALTPLKQAEVLEIQHFSVLAVGSRMRAMAIINECRRYLLNKERKSA